VPRFVYHIDEGAVAALTQYYRRTIKPGSDILDICSSWVSHYPLEFKSTMGRISGTGMNAFELRANSQLTGESTVFCLACAAAGANGGDSRHAPRHG